MTTTTQKARRDAGRGGFALILVILIMAITTAIVGASVTLGANHLLMNRYHERSDQLDAVADAGLEAARAFLNGYKNLYPDTGYVTIENGDAVADGAGGTLPGVKRWLYAGPTGITSGQYGVYGTVLSVARDEGGGVSIRRLGVTQESFAKFAYFTDIEPSNISFGGGDQIFGPVHTNDYLKIYSSGATFHDEARTAKTVQGASYGTFKKGYEENVSVIPMPETADLTKLQAQAAAGGTSFTGDTNGNTGSATTRIEFVAIDLNGDLDTTDDNEGFIRVYQSTDWRWVSGDEPSTGINDSEQCGDYHGTTFAAAADASHDGNWVWNGGWTYVTPSGHTAAEALEMPTRRCYLGGSDSIFGGFQATDSHGAWLAWGGTVSALLTGRADAAYLFPISRSLNPNFKGVIYVQGDVVLSGRLRGKVTVASTGDIIIGDDLTYVTDPGLGTCEDLMGIFSGDDVILADNTINTAQTPNGNWVTLDDTKDEFIHGVVLALSNFTVENYANGPTQAEWCESTVWGRGCLYLAGGIIQSTRGAVGTLSWTGATGYLKRYSYDACASKQPPPYYPTTGHFVRAQSYPVDPAGFSAAGFYAQFQMN